MKLNWNFQVGFKTKNPLCGVGEEGMDIFWNNTLTAIKTSFLTFSQQGFIYGLTIYKLAQN